MDKDFEVPFSSIDIYFTDPSRVLVPSKFDARDPHSKEVLEMAISIHKHGLYCPIECSKDTEGNYVLKHGYVRLMAVRMILRGFKYFCEETSSEVQFRDKKYRITVTL